MAQLIASRLMDIQDNFRECSYPTLVKYALIGTSGLTVSYALASKVCMILERRKVKHVREAHIQETNRIKNEWSQDSADQIDETLAQKIISMSYDELKNALKNKQLSASRVLKAYQYVAARENQKYNFVTEPFLNAQMLAESLDKASDSERATLPLFGIPVSIKENQNVAGMYTTAGFSHHLKAKTTEDSTSIQALRQLGAVPFIRTNVPQTLMTLGCHNPIYGETKNPLDPSRTPGGSSGGESAAISCGASILGFGSDIGGSIRVPSAWTGIVGLKPTCGRIGGVGVTKPISGQNIVAGTSGFMARSVSALVDSNRAMFSDVQFNLEPALPPLKFNEEMYSSDKSLTIAYCCHIDPIHTTESVKMAVYNTANQLSKLGHTVVEWNPPSTKYFNPWKMYFSSLYGDAGRQIAHQLLKDDISFLVAPFFSIFCMPQFVKKAAIALARPFMPSFITDFFTAFCGQRSVDDWWKLSSDVGAYRQLVIDDWKSKAIDVLLCPSVAAPPPNTGKPDGYIGFFYAWPFNLLNFPAGVVPVAKLTSEDVANDLDKYPCSDLFHSTIKPAIRGSEGLPISVQVAALPFHDELCLKIMSQIEEFGNWKEKEITELHQRIA